MGTDYSRLMENMVDTLESRVRELEARLARAACYPASYQICAEHPDLTSPDKRRPCPACLEKARADKAEAKVGAVTEAFWSAIAGSRLENKEWPMDALNIWNEARGLRAERDDALAQVERLREIEKAARAHIIEIDRAPGDDFDRLDAENVLRAKLFPKTCGHEKTHPDEVCRECLS